MPPKGKKNALAPASGSNGKSQQTLAQSLATKRQKRDEEEKNMIGCIQFVEKTETCELLEEKFVTTSSSCCEVYRRGSRVTQGSGPLRRPSDNASAPAVRRTSSRSKLSGGGSSTDLSNLLLPEIDESFEGSYRSCAWEEQGATFIAVLQAHTSDKTALPRKHQEFLFHVLLNADHHHTGPANLSASALDLLLLNERLHPISRPDPAHVHQLLTNRDLWRPNEEFSHERDCYSAICSTPRNLSPKLCFLLELLKGAKRIVVGAGAATSGQQRSHQRPPLPTASKGPGPLGCVKMLEYITHLLLKDYRARLKVFTACSHRRHVAERTGIKGDPKAVKVLRESALAELLCNKTSVEMLRGMVRDIILTLADLVIGEAEGSGQDQDIPAAAPRGSRPGPELAHAASLVPVLARQLLSSTYDLFLALEEEQGLIDKEAKDTDCRALVLTLQKLLDRRTDDHGDLKHRIRTPVAKSRLLRALSPRAAVHLLGVEYAIQAGKRWLSCKGGETVIQGEWKPLQPLVDYAEGRTTVRLICDEGPAKICPLALLQDLDVQDEHFSQGLQRLLSSGSGGGFVTWLGHFVCDSVRLAKNGELVVDVGLIKNAFSKLTARLEKSNLSYKDNEDQMHDMALMDHTKMVLGSF